jgi:hypothetical protein
MVFMYIASVPTIAIQRASAVVDDEDEEDVPKKIRRDSNVYIERKCGGKCLRLYDWFASRHFLLRGAIVFYTLVVIITVIESERFRTDPDFNIVRLLYEATSAYGSVGLTLGYPNTVTAFSAQLSWPSKFIMIILLLMGRHRGLPTDLDAAYTMRIRLTVNPDYDDDKAGRNSAVLETENPDECQVRTTDAEGQPRTYIVRRRTSISFFRTSASEVV